MLVVYGKDVFLKKHVVAKYRREFSEYEWIRIESLMDYGIGILADQVKTISFFEAGSIYEVAISSQGELNSLFEELGAIHESRKLILSLEFKPNKRQSEKMKELGFEIVECGPLKTYKEAVQFLEAQLLEKGVAFCPGSQKEVISYMMRHLDRDRMAYCNEAEKLSLVNQGCFALKDIQKLVMPDKDALFFEAVDIFFDGSLSEEMKIRQFSKIVREYSKADLIRMMYTLLSSLREFEKHLVEGASLRWPAKERLSRSRYKLVDIEVLIERLLQFERGVKTSGSIGYIDLTWCLRRHD